MKKKIFNSILALAAVFFVSCSNTQNKDTDSVHTEGTANTAEEHNDAKFNNDTEKDAKFVVEAANADLLEISLANLAVTRSTHAEIKDFAKMLVDAHTKSYEELSKLAASKNITIPTVANLDAPEYKTINDKNGNDFDKAFYNKNVEMHKDAVARFEEASKECQDADIRNYATSKLPDLRTHLDHAMDGQKLAESWN